MKDANVSMANQHRMDWRTLRNRQNELKYTRAMITAALNGRIRRRG
jgi:hypothetical protein